MFLKNVIVTLFTNIFVFIIAFFISVITARYLGPEGQGILALTLLFPNILLNFMNLGISMSSIYHLGENTNKKEMISSIITLNIILVLISLIIAFFIIFFIGSSIFPNIPKTYLIIGALFIPFQLSMITANAIILGFQKINIYNILNISQYILLLILILLVLPLLNTGIEGAIFANLFSIIAISLIAIISALKISQYKLYFRSLKFYKKNIKSLINFGFKIHVNNVFTFLYYRIDLILLNLYVNPISVGYYSISVGISEALWMVSQALSTVFFPKITSMDSEVDKNKFTPLVARNIFFLSIIISIFIFFISKWIIILMYSAKYLPSVEPLQILLIGTVSISMTRILANDISSRGKPEILAYISIIIFVVNLIINIILIPKIGIIGAAWATSISYALNLMIVTLIYKKLSKNNLKELFIIKKSDLKIIYNSIKK